ncbi:MAG: Nramp family divalent metal transporter [Alphaproteobacteria bacterium]
MLERAKTDISLAEVFRTVPIPSNAGFWRKMMAYGGPGYLVAVGYMDPGNWATSIAGGSGFGYTLISVIILANFMAMLLQSLSAKLGIVAGQDLAQACRHRYPKAVNISLWLLCEIAIVACDLAEVIGTAIALNLLFGLPLAVGVCLTVADVFLILLLQRSGFRKLEIFTISLMSVVAFSFIYEIMAAKPDFGAIAAAAIPTTRIFTDPAMLYIAIGVIGATVMPHNLYLHSSIVQTRQFGLTPGGKKEALRYAVFDTVVALFLALLINAAILIMAAAVFHKNGMYEVTTIEQAHQLLAPLLGLPLASTLFALALLASGQNSAVTATLAGQIVMEGFLQLRLPPWARRLITRMLAIIPAAFVTIVYGAEGTGKLLLLSQVVLSLQLPFAIVPLLQMTSDRKLMGEFVSRPVTVIAAWSAAILIIALNVKLLADVLL